MKKPMSIIMDKFPYLKHFKKRVNSRQKLININNRLIDEIPKKIENTTELYEKRKLEKELILLEIEQAKNHKQLNDDESFFTHYEKKMKSGVEKVNRNYFEVIDSAMKLIDTNSDIANKFTEYEKFDFSKNWEAKVSFYLELEILLEKISEESKK